MHWEISRCFGFIRIFVSMDNGEIIIYRTADGETRLEVRMESDSVWLTQAQIARLFGVDRTVIVRHVNNIYKSCELEREATCAKIAHVQHEGLRQVRRMIPYYNLDMILSIGYRVNMVYNEQIRMSAQSGHPFCCKAGFFVFFLQNG